MRAAAAALPEPCSATTSMGTSFCDNSRITASTVRIPALTLSTQTRTAPFGGVPIIAGISALSRPILFRFSVMRPERWGVPGQGPIPSRAHTLPILAESIGAPRICICLYVNDLRPAARVRHTAHTLPHCGQMGNLLPISWGNLWGYFPTSWGSRPNSVQGLANDDARGLGTWRRGIGNSFPFFAEPGGDAKRLNRPVLLAAFTLHRDHLSHILRYKRALWLTQ